MKKMIVIALMLLVATSNVQAYDYSYKNGTNKTIYFEPLAWGVTEQFSFFKGDTGANDGWAVKGPQVLQPGQNKSYSFKGVWCHGGIRVGTSMNNMKEVPLFKADQEQYNKIVDSLEQIGAITSATPLSVVGGIPALLWAGAEIARLLNKNLCRSYGFIIGQKEDGSFFATATPF